MGYPQLPRPVRALSQQTRRVPQKRRPLFKLERLPDYFRDTVHWIIGFVSPSVHGRLVLA